MDEAGLWMYDDTETPLELAAQRGLSRDVLEIIARLPRDAPTAGMDAMRAQDVRVMRGDLSRTLPEVQEIYWNAGIRTICYVPVVFQREPLGLLVLYHHRDYPWTADEMELARAFADHMAAAIGNARLASSTRTLASRLRVIAELAGRLSNLRDVTGIANAIVAESRQLIEYDSIRVYRVDHVSGFCEPIASQCGVGQPAPDAAVRVRIGEGLTGWVAEHGATVRLGDAVADPRTIVLEGDGAPASALLVPMIYEGVVHGVLVVSKDGADRFDADDETTLTIFAGYAAHAIVNATSVERLERQQKELEHQLDGQRRLLEVNERLLSTLDAAGVLELIADSLKALVRYDSLTVYRADRGAGVRRAVIARDRFADLILAHEAPLGIGITGWVIDHGEAVLSNEAHVDPRSVQVPGTPFEPEAMIVCPLLVDGETIGTLNIGRMGEAEAAFSDNEFELTKLFAGQASIALQNAEAHGAVQVRAEHDALTGLRNHGAFQRELGDAVAGGGRPFSILMLDMDNFKSFNDACGHPAGDALLAAIAKAMSAATREGDRLYRYGGDEFSAILPGADRRSAHEVADRIRRAVVAQSKATEGPPVTISVGVACFPDDGTAKDILVGVADQALYLAKPSGRTGRPQEPQADPYLRALDETAIALLDRHGQDELLDTILTRATAMLGTPHGFIDLVEADGATLVLRHGTGLYTELIGYRLSTSSGLAGQIFRTGQALAVDDYDAWTGRQDDLPFSTFKSVVGVPLTSTGQVVGVLGLSSGGIERQWGQREVAALTGFAQLASIAIDNVRLVDEANRGALYDPTTGLPNRELLTDRIAHALTLSRPDGPTEVGVILLDLDRFKVINESVGHAVGDRLLLSVGQRLTACLRPSDTVARFGGDEFAILLESVVDGEADRIAERIEAELRTPFAIGDREWFISASLGISLGRPGRATPDEMLREAEIAMVKAKADPARRHALFEPSMSSQTIERLDLENDLRRGIERDELRLHYQPMVDLADGRVVGFEALVRWQHPVRGMIPPMAFVPLAEETGLILPLGRWVLESACRQARAWRDARPDGGALFMSVNLSAREFAQPDLVANVAAILDSTGLDPGGLEIEITESVLMDQTEAGIRTLRDLRSLGVRLVLDDFGTGYSSLSYLKHLPLDTIKIDRTFVNGMDTHADRSIVDAVISLAHGLGIGVVAEGIETEVQARELRELGCDLGQGYLFAKPLAAADAGRLLRRRRPGATSRAGRPAVAAIAVGRSKSSPKAVA